MTSPQRPRSARTRSPRRAQPLSREQIVEAAVELLDAAGERGLTSRALAQRLNTGFGAIAWHAGNRQELLATATDTVVAVVLIDETGDNSSGDARARIRSIALALFVAINDHPWLATQIPWQLSHQPLGPTSLRIYESLGRPVRALGVPQNRWFAATSAPTHYILAAAAQNATNVAAGADLGADADRREFLDDVATAWEELDPHEYSFMHAVAGQLREHDDRDQFMAGVDLILDGAIFDHTTGNA